MATGRLRVHLITLLLPFLLVASCFAQLTDKCPATEVKEYVRRVLSFETDDGEMSTEIRKRVERNLGGRWGVIMSRKSDDVDWSIADEKMNDDRDAYCLVEMGDWYFNVFKVDREGPAASDAHRHPGERRRRPPPGSRRGNRLREH